MLLAVVVWRIEIVTMGVALLQSACTYSISVRLGRTGL